VKRSEKKDFVEKLKDEISNSSAIIVAEYSGLTVDESENLRNEMRANGAKFKVTKNRLTKLAIAETHFKEMSDLFKGPTAIAYSTDPVAPAKVAVSFEKKFDKFKIIGGGYNGEKN
jgi:large subunit ribosomal protein L10